MARVTLADVWVPETFGSYQTVDPIMQSAFVTSGILASNPNLQEAASGSGYLSTTPFWNPIDSTIEPNYGNDVYTDIADTQKITMGEQTVRIASLNEGWSSASLVSVLVGKDPLKQIATQIDGYWVEQLQRRLISTAIGVYNDNVTDGASDMIVDKSSANMTVAAGNLFSASNMITAQLTMGDRIGKFVGMAVHSIVYANMLGADMIQFIKPSATSLEIPTYAGMYVVVDDGMPIVGGNGTTVAYKYLTIFFGRGAFGYGAGQAKIPFEYEREASRGNGEGFDTLWVRKRWVIHPEGYDYKSVTTTGPGLSPTWADLKLATNWERKLVRKNVRLAFLVTNG